MVKRTGGNRIIVFKAFVCVRSFSASPLGEKEGFFLFCFWGLGLVFGLERERPSSLYDTFARRRLLLNFESQRLHAFTLLL